VVVSARLPRSRFGTPVAPVVTTGRTRRPTGSSGFDPRLARSYATTNRRPVHWIARRVKYSVRRGDVDPKIESRRDPGEVERGTLSRVMHGILEPLDAHRVEELVAKDPWAFVETRLRTYAARIQDHRHLTPEE
jgi:hypothetical protein